MEQQHSQNNLREAIDDLVFAEKQLTQAQRDYDNTGDPGRQKWMQQTLSAVYHARIILEKTQR